MLGQNLAMIGHCLVEGQLHVRLARNKRSDWREKTMSQFNLMRPLKPRILTMWTKREIVMKSGLKTLVPFRPSSTLSNENLRGISYWKLGLRFRKTGYYWIAILRSLKRVNTKSV